MYTLAHFKLKREKQPSKGNIKETLTDEQGFTTIRKLIAILNHVAIVCNSNYKKFLKSKYQHKTHKKIITWKRCNEDCDTCLKSLRRIQQNNNQIGFNSSSPETREKQIVKQKEDIYQDDSSEIIEKKIKAYNISDFSVSKTIGDGNCLFRSILTATGYFQENYMELKEELAKYASSIDIEMDFITQRDFQNKEQYIEQLRADGFYGDHLEIQLICKRYNMWIAVLDIRKQS